MLGAKMGVRCTMQCGTHYKVMEQKNGTRIPNFRTSYFAPNSTISDSGETWQAISGTNVGGRRCDDCANTSFCCERKMEHAF